MAHAQKLDFVFRRNGRIHLNLWGRQFSRLLAAEVCASAVVMLDTTYSEVVWRVLAIHSIRQFPSQFPSRASPCVTIFQLDSTTHLTTTEIFAQIRIGDTSNRNQTSIIRSPWLSIGNKSIKKCPLIGILCVRFEEHLLWATQKRISLDKLFAQRMWDEWKKEKGKKGLRLRPQSKWDLRLSRILLSVDL